MSNKHRIRWAAFTESVFLFLLAFATASAADFDVAPTQLYLANGNTSSEVTVTNESNQAVTVSVAGYLWNESPTGLQQLKPSTDFVVFPAIFTLVPLQQQIIRVGVTGNPGPVERAYRVVVSELPPPQVKIAARGAFVRILTALSLPVFLSPLQEQDNPQISGLHVSGRKLEFQLANQGTVHLPPATVTIHALGADGRSLWSHDVELWYVLAGDSRNISVALPQDVCGRARSYKVTVSGTGLNLDRTFADVPASCTG